MTGYRIALFDSIPELSELRFIELSNHLWAEDYPHFFSSRASVGAVKNKGLFVVMISDETCPKAVYTKKDDPVYKDSCMEFFFQPFSDDARYMNFEINPNGACLSEIGTCRSDRIFIKEITAVEPEITVFPVEKGWAVSLFISEQLVSQVFGREFSLSETGYICANFYKCGEETRSPHFSSAFFVGSTKPDFHRPEYFEKLYFDTV